MDITVDLYVTAEKIREDIQIFTRSLPDSGLLELLDHFAEQDEEFSDQEADEYLREGLTRTCIIAFRRERDRRSENI